MTYLVFDNGAYSRPNIPVFHTDSYDKAEEFIMDTVTENLGGDKYVKSLDYDDFDELFIGGCEDYEIVGCPADD
jgi:hypothetical protein